jgi:hypothetical protein
VLGQTISGGTCDEDIRATVDILVRNPSTAPNISKKLILRLAKSNPKPDYVRRVATVFRNSNGDLKKVVKAILLDPEIWKNIKEGKKVKIKEPYEAFVHLGRVFNMTPFKYVELGNKKDPAKKMGKMLNTYYFWGFANGLYPQFGEWPLQSPTVFNFFSDEYKTNSDEFKIRGFVAPEAEILTSKYTVNAFNRIAWTLVGHPLYVQIVRAGKQKPEEIEGYHAGYLDYYKITYERYYAIYKEYFGQDLLQKAKDDTTRDTYLHQALERVVDKLAVDLLGHKIKDRDRQAIIDELDNQRFNQQQTTTVAKNDLARLIIGKAALRIVMSEDFMTK